MWSQEEVKPFLRCPKNLDSRLSKAAKTEKIYLHQTCLSTNRHRMCLWGALVPETLLASVSNPFKFQILASVSLLGHLWEVGNLPKMSHFVFLFHNSFFIKAITLLSESVYNYKLRQYLNKIFIVKYISITSVINTNKNMSISSSSPSRMWSTLARESQQASL
jgi:hypothetical protein